MLLALALVGVIGFVVVPRVGFALAKLPRPERVPLQPWLSAALFTVSWLLPSPEVGGTSTFTQHAVGGGAACAVAALYVALNTGLRWSFLRIGFAYAAAAALGTGIELLELLHDEVRGTHLTADSAWDLLANSVGAVVAALALEAGLRALRGRTPPGAIAA